MRNETETAEYMGALMQMFEVHMCTVVPFPGEFVACFQVAMEDCFFDHVSFRRGMSPE